MNWRLTTKRRRLAAIGPTLVAVTIVTPFAAADPQTRYLPGYDASLPRLGEHLSGADRSWLTSSSESPVARAPNGGFAWGDAGIGAGTALAAVLTASGGALLIRRHATAAH